MTRNSRELSQFASFVEVRDANQNIGITTSLVMLGGVGIGSTVGDYLAEKTARGSVDPLINFNESYLLDDVYIEGQLNIDGGTSGSITGAGATFPALNVGGLTTTSDLIVYDGVYIGDISGRTSGLGTIQINTLKSDPGIAGTEFIIVSPIGNSFTLVEGPIIFQFPDTPYQNNDYDIFFDPKVVFTDSIRVGAFRSDVQSTVGLISATRLTLDSLPSSTTIAPQFTISSPSRFGRVSGFGDTEGTAAVYVDGGLDVTKYGYVGYAFSVGESITIGSSYLNNIGGPNKSSIYTNLEVSSREIYVGLGLGTDLPTGVNPGNLRTQLILDAEIVGDIIPDPSNRTVLGIGSAGGAWGNAFIDFLQVNDQANIENLEVSLGSTVGFLNVVGSGGTDPNETYLSVGPGLSSFRNINAQGDIYFDGTFFFTGLATFTGPGGSLVDGYITTSFQANNVDLYKQDQSNSTQPEFFYPAMANAGISQTTVGGQLFVNPGFYLDAFSTSLFVSNNLNVLGTAINASEETAERRFDLLNYGVTELNLASQASYIDIGQAEQVGSITSIRSEVTELVRLRLRQNDIQASTGATNITLNEDINTNFAGWVQIGGTYIKVDSNVINIADTPQRADLFKSAEDVVIGADDLGIATIRNNVTDLTGFLKLGKNVIQASDGTNAIQIGAAATYTEITGDLIVGGKDIQDGIGITNITLVGDTKTIFYGDIEIRGNEILSSDGNVNILMLDGQELTSFTGPIRVEGNQIQAGTGDTNITLQSNQNTIFAGAIEIDGDEIRASNGQPNILMDSDLLTTVSGDIKVGTGTVRAGDGTICIAMEGGTGNVAITSDVSANSAFFNGVEARLNVQDVDIRDNLLTIGLIEDPTTQGTLIPPNVSIGNSGDVGLVMARYDVGLSTHKYAAIYYDNSEGRVAIRTDVQDAGLGVGRDRYLISSGLPSELEVQNLYVNINSTLGIKTIFEANTRDDGETITEVLNLVNVEIDGGVFA